MRHLFVVLAWLVYPLPLYALDLAVKVDGLEKKLEENVLAYLSVERERQRESLNESRLHLLHGKAEEEIKAALRPFGYFDVKVIPSMSKVGEGYKVLYKVDPGSAVKFSDVDYRLFGEGADDPQLQKTFPILVGEALDQPRYDQVKQQMLAEVIESGYLDARYIEHELRVDLKAYSASIKLHLETGMRLRFGEVRMHQDILNPEYLARFIPFNSGEPFSQEAVLKLQADLIDTEYFKQVEVVTRRDQKTRDLVPIDVKLKRNKRNRYRIGLGYSTDTGPRLTLDWKNRRRGEYGHRIQSKLQLSRPVSTLSTEYIIPLARPTVDFVTLGASLEHYNSDTNQGNRALLSAAHSMSLDRGWRRTVGLEYSYEDFEVGEQEDNSRLLVPSISWLRIKSDKKAYIQRGKRLELRLEGARQSLLSSTNYFQLYAAAKFIRGIGEGDWRVLNRFELGATWADELTDLPPSKRFFAGGDNTVRGFGYQDLGPQDENEEVIGGRYFAVGNIELERRIVGKWSGAVFLDVGNAYDPDYERATAYGAGFGARWRSPVGPVRIDIAHGRVDEDEQWRIHVVIGPEL